MFFPIFNTIKVVIVLKIRFLEKRFSMILRKYIEMIFSIESYEKKIYHGLFCQKKTFFTTLLIPILKISN